jgi:hypothetical protein
MTRFENVGVFIREKFWLKNSYFPVKLTPPMKIEQSVPKRRHIKFRRQGITQSLVFKKKKNKSKKIGNY